MRIRRLAIENVRSFLENTELLLDGSISILIGPNGGGKTNLLDTLVVMLRKHIYTSMYLAPSPTAEEPDRQDFRANDVMNQMILERFTGNLAADQKVTVELEVTAKDLDTMRGMQKDAPDLIERAGSRIANSRLGLTENWTIDALTVGSRLTYSLVNGTMVQPASESERMFLEYLNLFEVDARLRDIFGIAPLSVPLIYLPVNRGAAGVQSSVSLASHNEYDVKRQLDGVNSRTQGQVMVHAIARLAKKYRLLLEDDKGTALVRFNQDKNLMELRQILKRLGYEWELVTVNPLLNQYDIKLTKQGSSFLVGAASSGEREIFIYLFAIFALNVRDAIIIVDEPELHLHPKWQKALVDLFIELARTTGNQFLLATHSPTFISPESIQYVSRVYTDKQRSRIARLNSDSLPDAKHLLNIVNSQNNERLFFADKVVLVEGVSDRIFFERLLQRVHASSDVQSVIEIISVGGKGMFEPYSNVLNAAQIHFSIIADLDYLEQIGPAYLKKLFETDVREIKSDVLENSKSLDGISLVAAIDTAIENGTWSEASEIWTYIKSRRSRLRKDLTSQESSLLEKFLADERVKGVFLLTLGSLEDYLPVGFRSKDLQKLILFLENAKFWDELRAEGKPELNRIAETLFH